MDQCAGLSESVRLSSHFVGFLLDLINWTWFEFSRICSFMEMIIGMIKQCKYMYSLRIQDYFECFNWLPFSLRNHFSKKTLFRNAIRAPNSLDPDQVPYLVGLIWVQNVCKTEDIMNRAKCYNFN